MVVLITGEIIGVNRTMLTCQQIATYGQTIFVTGGTPLGFGKHAITLPAWQVSKFAMVRTMFRVFTS